MSTKIYQTSIKTAQEYIKQIEDLSHGMDHIAKVVELSAIIAKNFPQVDQELIEVAAWWHDVGRLQCDEGHEKVSAQMADENLKKLGLKEDKCQIVFNAIINHRWMMTPKTLEGKIIRDADKLDFLSVDRIRYYINNDMYFIVEMLAERIPHVRNEMLSLDISKNLFDKMAIPFLESIKQIEEPQFKPFKDKIVRDLGGK